MSSKDAWRVIAMLNIFTVQEIDFLMVGRAVAVHLANRINYCDALIAAAAERAGAEILMTEDLKDGQVLQGITVHNPFKGCLPL